MRAAWLLLLTALLAGCAATRPASAPDPRAPSAIEAALQKHIDVLASDAFEGRRPGTEGEAKTLRYLAREWQAAGLVSGTNDPANPWFAPVELSHSLPDSSSAKFYREGRPVGVPEGSVSVFVAGNRGLVERAPVLFVGEAGENLDRSELAGRIVLMLWEHAGQAEQREALLAAGAAAVLTVVRDGKDFATLDAFRRRGSYRLASNEVSGAIDGYVSRAGFEALVGADYAETLYEAARRADFKPVGLGLTASLEATSDPGSVRTYNLLGRLTGKKPGAGAVLLLAHWDHFGLCGEAGEVCNGAVDNASGLAVLTELAKRLGQGPRMDRDVYFLATTAEEWGLLGAQAFAENPPVPLDTIVAAFNLDAVAVAPAGGSVAIVGKGLTRIDPGIAQVLRETGRSEADGRLAQAYVRRQDAWALVQRDVPAVAVTSAFADERALAKYTAERYHLPADKPVGVELGGAAEDLRLHLALVRYFADPARWAATSGKSVPEP